MDAAAEFAPTVYVVDDDESIRTLWRWLMESNGIPVQTFATAQSFIESFSEDEAGCLVLDLDLPGGMSGLGLQEHLTERGIDIPTVFVSGRGDVPAAVSALKGGAVDFIEKPFDHREVMGVIRAMLERAAERRALSVRLAALTDREREVMRLVVDGRQNKQIADALDISVKTVEAHRARVMAKTGATSVAELVQLTFRDNE